MKIRGVENSCCFIAWGYRNNTHTLRAIQNGLLLYTKKCITKNNEYRIHHTHMRALDKPNETIGYQAICVLQRPIMLHHHTRSGFAVFGKGVQYTERRQLCVPLWAPIVRRLSLICIWGEPSSSFVLDGQQRENGRSMEDASERTDDKTGCRRIEPK